jgi:hypothetical protein
MTLTPEAKIEDRDGELTVWYDWPGVDRPQTYGIGINGGSRKLAERLVRAIEAGAAYADPEIKTDVNGKTYVQARSLVLARCLNADLRRLGY